LIWGALSDERTGLSFTMYNIQYILLSELSVSVGFSFYNFGLDHAENIHCPTTNVLCCCVLSSAGCVYLVIY
jgi:hypothetical protein